MSPEGRDWVISCLDPFHDYQQSTRGYPDTNSNRSVVQMLNQTATISAPAGTVGNWDMRLVYTGLQGVISENNDDMTGASTTSHQVWDSSVGHTGNEFAPLMVFTSGSGDTPNYVNYVGGTVEMPVHWGTTTITGHKSSRVIGMAIEVHNPTAAINKQGIVTSAMVNAIPQLTNVILTDAKAVDPMADSTWTHCCIGPFPATAASIRNIPGSGQWEASKGVYLIPRLFGPAPPVNDVTFIPNTYSENAAIGFNNAAYHTTPVVTTDGTLGRPGFAPSGFSPVMCYFQGLSLTSTLQVTFRTIIEYFPPYGDPLLQSAQPSPIYDPIALSIYNTIAISAPYAVPVDFNDAGKYFRMILNLVSQLGTGVSPILSAINPVAGLVARGVGAAAGAASAVIDRARARKEAEARARVNKLTAGRPADPMIGGPPLPRRGPKLAISRRK